MAYRIVMILLGITSAIQGGWLEAHRFLGFGSLLAVTGIVLVVAGTQLLSAPEQNWRQGPPGGEFSRTRGTGSPCGEV
ncbi:MAG: hypothetical protein M0Z53_05715 [Thermaerobacter sp.]|nr:hypothetical protein [Thermaerobacter sp.]